MPDIVIDSLTDSIKLVPFLAIIYLFIEWVERDVAIRQKTTNLLKGKTAPLIGSALGVVPQCGFSIVSANLYLAGLIKCGTLIAVMIATSDEALPIILANSTQINHLWTFLVVKVLYATVVGFVVNLFDKSTTKVDLTVETNSKNDGCCHHDVKEKPKDFWSFLFHPVKHTFKVFLYVFIINLAFGSLIYFVGEENVAYFLIAIRPLQPLLATVVGLVPNCASSVILANMFVQDLLPFSATMAGLCANSGGYRKK